jgi:amino acid transporter
VQELDAGLTQQSGSIAAKQIKPVGQATTLTSPRGSGSTFPVEGGPYEWARMTFGRPARAVTAVLYWPSNPIWIGGTLSATVIAATLLPSGQVLVAGGNGTCVPFSCPALSSAELYNPAAGLWAPTGSMTIARTDHTATLLPNGQVLVAGGTFSGGGSPAELYHPPPAPGPPPAAST